jgi:uncharacterized phage protein (TIGR01671 family)
MLQIEGNMHPRQPTGLTDKYGKEIYNGDILKYSFQTKEKIYPPYTIFYAPGWQIWEIKYIAPSFVYIIHSQDNSYYGELPSNPKVISLHYLNAVEIIGNKYENPELLKGDKHEIQSSKRYLSRYVETHSETKG